MGGGAGLHPNISFYGHIVLVQLQYFSSSVHSGFYERFASAIVAGLL